MMDIATALLVASLFVPQASDRQIAESPLEKGEAAYVDTGDGFAKMLVGGENGKALRVKDTATIHGWQYEFIDRANISIVATDGLTYNGTADKWTAPTTLSTNTITIQCASGVVIDEVTYDLENQYELGMCVTADNGTATVDYRDNIAVITMERIVANASEFSVANIKVRRILAGNPFEVNDLTSLRFLLRDTLGEIEFQDLREWAQNRWNGNRGEDWSEYVATKRVKLEGNSLQLSYNNRFAIEVAETQTVFRAANHDAVVLSATGTGEGYWGGLDLYSVTPTETGVDLGWLCDITGFTQSSLVIRGSADLQNWSDMPFTIDGRTLHITCASNIRFFRAYYNGTLVDECKVMVNVPLYVNDALFLKGEDNAIYRITVSGGVISATAVNQ